MRQRVDAIIAGLAAESVQAIVKRPYVWEQPAHMTVMLCMGSAVHTLLCQNRFNSVNSGVKSDSHCPISVRRSGFVKTLEKSQIVSHLSLMQIFVRHNLSPLEQEECARRIELTQRSSLPKQDMGKKLQLAQFINRLPFYLSDRIHQAQVKLVSDHMHFPSFVSLHKQSRFHLEQLGNLLHRTVATPLLHLSFAKPRAFALRSPRREFYHFVFWR